jgi:hypothetical protein
MSVTAYLEFAGAAVLFSPKLALEDTLRYFDVDVPKHGLLRNDQGRSIMEIWDDSEFEVNKKRIKEQEKHEAELNINVKVSSNKKLPEFTIPEGA